MPKYGPRTYFLANEKHLKIPINLFPNLPACARTCPDTGTLLFLLTGVIFQGRRPFFFCLLLSAVTLFRGKSPLPISQVAEEREKRGESSCPTRTLVSCRSRGSIHSINPCLIPTETRSVLVLHAAKLKNHEITCHRRRSNRTGVTPSGIIRHYCV